MFLYTVSLDVLALLQEKPLEEINLKIINCRKADDEEKRMYNISPFYKFKYESPRLEDNVLKFKKFKHEVYFLVPLDIEEELPYTINAKKIKYNQNEEIILITALLENLKKDKFLYKQMINNLNYEIVEYENEFKDYENCCEILDKVFQGEDISSLNIEEIEVVRNYFHRELCHKGIWESINALTKIGQEIYGKENY